MDNNFSNIIAFAPVTALKQHLFSGHRVTLLEAQLLFGIRNLTSELTRLRQSGYKIESRSVPMVRVLRRLNETAQCHPPTNLPIKKLKCTEWWIVR